MAERELPRYKCHKEVHALKIGRIVIKIGGGAVMDPVEEGYRPFGVSKEYLKRHNPIAGGYYVVYEDGYKSFSPSPTFEKGYIRMSEEGVVGSGPPLSATP